MGKDRAGMDCIGLVIAVRRDCFGVETDPGPYAKTIPVADLISRLTGPMVRVARHQMWSGDVVVFALDSSSISHCGIFDAETFSLIHSHATERKAVEQVMSEYWNSRIAAVFRWPQ
jgi:cell wall-associated NlpC family hydrolase